MKFLDKLLEGGFRHTYWKLKNKLFGESKDGCLCTMREECRSCWTHLSKGFE